MDKTEVEALDPNPRSLGHRLNGAALTIRRLTDALNLCEQYGPEAVKLIVRQAKKEVAALNPPPPAGDTGEAVAWMWEETVDPTGEVIHGKTIQRVAFHWSTPPKNVAVTPLYAQPSDAALRGRVAEAVARLVLAARAFAYSDPFPEDRAELDKALEAFSERVPWADQPDEELGEEKKGVSR